MYPHASPSPRAIHVRMSPVGTPGVCIGESPRAIPEKRYVLYHPAPAPTPPRPTPNPTPRPARAAARWTGPRAVRPRAVRVRRAVSEPPALRAVCRCDSRRKHSLLKSAPAPNHAAVRGDAGVGCGGNSSNRGTRHPTAQPRPDPSAGPADRAPRRGPGQRRRARGRAPRGRAP